ncbi:MAG: gluconate 2-dehydrogenase subunit 3 family protein [Acidisphaera sp.]|nr:gluconate 2-dehydrogenase subunit 3 family protein [Acidisphaera sp.]
MSNRYPGYDVLAKRHTPSWNEQTRRVIDKRLAISGEPRFFTAQEYALVGAICARIVPQPSDRAPIPVAALLDEKLVLNALDGYRDARLPPLREAWRRGLRALDEAAREAHGVGFTRLDAAEQDALLKRAEEGKLEGPAWEGMPSKLFFEKRLLRDIVLAYYAHPTSWSEIGWGGPASPRGYVRMGFNRRDPWEAAEAHGDDDAKALRENRRVG